ncbi:MYXO-CTERM sorting domain-containing protein [Nannocystis sp. SCPEA4]|uniref:MYXO-CTERM sorting domain-containing protein n=1 Tax=Nannocystis sp. SCPEA4 TaxID=2996787 RepID=UPI002271379C|nr:MYXO-CTERM sorting domain-containing protein [Nannocystis sp. SCPEA4]MCY1059962.1 MYXO-CTERM sorting domain-containing protein [Nannocystis sp. SCPEA4]
MTEGVDAVVLEFKRWLRAHPDVAGLAAMPDLSPLDGLTPWPMTPRTYGTLTTIRLEQRYRGVEVMGAGETVTLTVSPQHGVIAVHGSIADARETYVGWDSPITPEAAIAAGEQLLAVLQLDDEIEPVQWGVADPRRVAIVELRTMAYQMRLLRNGRDVGVFTVKADDGAMLDMSLATSSSLPDPEPVTVRSRTFQSDTYLLDDAAKQFVADLTQLDGAPLLGSSYMPLACQDDPEVSPQCGETRLGNLEVAVVDALGHDIEDKQAMMRPPTSLDGTFLAQPPATKGEPVTPETRAAAMQDMFYRLLATFRLFQPLKAGRWDSLWGPDTKFPADEFVPRLVYFHDAPCIDGAAGCAGFYYPRKIVEGKPTDEYDEHPWSDLPAHRPPEGPDEGMGKIVLSVESFRSVDVVFHEFGHILDLFSFPNTLGYGVVGSGCAGPGDMMCQPACVPDSTDESDALKETLADFMGIFAIGRLYSGLTYDSYCSAVSAIANQGSTPVHGPKCVINGSQIRSFLDERPDEPGFIPDDDGLIPTGKCNLSQGYRQGALVQAWWEWTHGQDCDLAAPFTCAAFGEESFGATTGVEAMLYSLNLSNSTYYRKFLTDAETYLQCVHGDGLGARWRDVWCHHGGLACESMPSPCPAICGDGQVGGDEACDQSDLAENTCSDLGFVGGALGCKLDCTFDTSQCEPGETPTTGDAPTTGSAPPGASTDGSGGETASDSATAGGGDVATDAGCGCATGPQGSAWLLGLAPLLLVRRRRLDTRADAR